MASHSREPEPDDRVMSWGGKSIKFPALSASNPWTPSCVQQFGVHFYAEQARYKYPLKITVHWRHEDSFVDRVF